MLAYRRSCYHQQLESGKVKCRSHFEEAYDLEEADVHKNIGRDAGLVRGYRVDTHSFWVCIRIFPGCPVINYLRGKGLSQSGKLEELLGGRSRVTKSTLDTMD